MSEEQTYKDIFNRVCDSVEFCEFCPLEKECPERQADALHVSSTGLPHYSHSQFFRFQMCGISYKYRYIDKIKTQANFRMVVGSSCHKGAQKNFGQKITSFADLATKDVVDETISYYDKKILDAEVDFDDKGRNRQDVVGEKQDKVSRLMTYHMDKFSPYVFPTHVEQKQEIIIPGIDMSLLGYMDLVDTQKHVRDLKVPKRKKSQADVDASLQFSIYWLMYMAIFKEPPSGVIADCLVDYKSKGPQMVSVPSIRTQQDIQRVINLIYALHENIKKGNFIPCSPEAWNCSEKYCEYWFHCIFGGKTK